MISFCFLTSCLKDRKGTESYAHSPALVGFQYKGFGQVPIIASVFGTAQDTASVEVTLSVASITLNSPVTLTVVPYSAGLDSFNAAQTPVVAYKQLDPSLYTVQDAGKITINPGQQFVSFRVNFAGDKVDFTKKNGLAFKINDAQGATIASNLNTAVILLTLRSVFQGNYHVSGIRVHPTLGPFPFDYDADLNTVNATTVTGNILADLGEGLTITINPDNSLVLVGESRAVFPQAGKVNKYDPATKTITLNYFYNTGAPRLINETIVLN